MTEKERRRGPSREPGNRTVQVEDDPMFEVPLSRLRELTAQIADLQAQLAECRRLRAETGDGPTTTTGGD